MLNTSNVYNNVGLVAQTVNHDGSLIVYVYNELNERVASIRIGAGQTLDFNPLSFTLSNVIARDKYLISETTERTENTEGDWWKCVASVSYMPGENALTTSVQKVQLTGLTLNNNSRTESIDADGVTTINSEAINTEDASKRSLNINVTLGITNVTHYVAGYETVSSNSLGSVSEHLYDGFSRRVKTTNYANERELKSVGSKNSSVTENNK